MGTRNAGRGGKVAGERALRKESVASGSRILRASEMLDLHGLSREITAVLTRDSKGCTCVHLTFRSPFGEAHGQRFRCFFVGSWSKPGQRRMRARTSAARRRAVRAFASTSGISPPDPADLRRSAVRLRSDALEALG